MTTLQRGNLWLFLLAVVAYLLLMFAAPHRASTASNVYHLSATAILLLTIPLLVLFFLVWVFGFYAWLQLNRYSESLPAGVGRQAFAQMGWGVWLLAAGLIVSSLVGGVKAFFGNDVGATAIINAVNYYIILFFPLFGFIKLRNGSHRLAVSAQAVMTTRAKFFTIGPPVLLLTVFYAYLSATNFAPDSQVLRAGFTGFLILPVSVLVVAGSWVFGLLTALNIERATHGREGASYPQPLFKLYNGILITTGGFIILDALESLGSARLGALPVAAIVVLIYAFFAVVALGFFMVAAAARGLMKLPAPKTGV